MNRSPPPPAARGPARWRAAVAVVPVAAVVATAGWVYHLRTPEYRFARGREAVLAKNWTAADRYADQLDAAGARDLARLLRGESLYRQGQPVPALEMLRGLGDDPAARRRALPLVGLCLLEAGDLRGAYQVLTAALEQHPDNVDVLRGLGALAYDLGQFDTAVARLERVAELAPDDGRPLRLIGLMRKDMSKYPEAEEAYRAALARSLPREMAADARFELAEVCGQLGRHAAALDELDARRAAGATEGAAVVALRADCLRNLGRRPDAIALLERALAARPDDPAAARVRGQIALEDGDAATAARWLEEVVRLAPGDYEGHYLLAQAYAARGRTADADRERGQAKAVRADLDAMTALSKEAIQHPWDAAVRDRLAEACDRVHRPELARMWRAAAATCRNPRP